jgi:hypothetical protein
MKKRTYITPTVAYVGPDTQDPSIEAALPYIVNVAASVAQPVVTNVVNRTGL